MIHWPIPSMTDAVADAMQQALNQADLEQAVLGPDARNELALHPLIQQGLAQAGYGIHPEQRYPSARNKRQQNQGKRCDLALTPDRLPLADPNAEATLFADPRATTLQEAYWLEIKTVAQFTTDGPARRYAAELLQPVTADVKKLAQDPLIRHGGLLLILFNDTQTTAEHDLAVWHDRCLNKRLPVTTPIIRGLPMTDRLGNAYCSLAWFDLRRL